MLGARSDHRIYTLFKDWCDTYHQGGSAGQCRVRGAISSAHCSAGSRYVKKGKCAGVCGHYAAKHRAARGGPSSAAEPWAGRESRNKWIHSGAARHSHTYMKGGFAVSVSVSVSDLCGYYSAVQQRLWSRKSRMHTTVYTSAFRRVGQRE